MADRNNEERREFLNKKAIEEAREQERELVFDFDEAWSEYKTLATPYRIKFLGQVYEISRSVPFSFMVFSAANCYTRDNSGRLVFQIPEDKIMDYLRAMFGKEFTEALAKSDVDVNFVMKKIVPKVFELWGMDMNTGEVTQGKNG